MLKVIFLALALFALSFLVLYTVLELYDRIWYRVTVMVIFSALISMLVTSNLTRFIFKV